jgi:N-acetylmuramoyl-L-alanine amidase
MNRTSMGIMGIGTILAASAAFVFQGLAGPEAPVEMAAPATAAAPAAPVIEAWRRPPGPVRVALQAGHWKAEEAPDEQAGLRDNGTRGGGKAEWEVNLEIAERAARILRDSGYVVDILPTTIPPGYWADLFVSIHADGNPSPAVSGYRAASPRRDATGRAAEFARVLDRLYGESTGLAYYPTVTRRMRGYYAFNHRRYDHALHPMTVGVILETGFLSSPRDRRVLIGEPDRAAAGIARGVMRYMGPVPPLAEPAVTRGLTLRQERKAATANGDEAR